MVGAIDRTKGSASVSKASIVRSRLAVLVAVGATLASVLAAAPPAMARPGRHVLSGSRPRWLSRARAVGTAPAAASTIRFGVLLKTRDAGGAEATLAAVSDPSSPRYGEWLTGAAFRSRFAPAAGDVAAVQAWLRGQGFALRDTLAGGLFVEASGTTAEIDKAFGTTVRNYEYQGRTVRANSTDLSLPATTPAAVTGIVAGVVGVDQGTALKEPAATLPGPGAGFRPGTPCSAYYGQKIATDQPAVNGTKKPYVVCGYEPSQYQSAYGESALLRRGVDGRGVTVAVTDAYASPTIVADTREYNRRHHLPAFRRGQFSQVTPAPDGYQLIEECDPQGWYGEETLDIEAVHAMAPGARIVYVGASDCDTGLDETWAKTIDDHVADIVTNSWGSSTDKIEDLGAAYVAFYQAFSMQAALTGITVNFSSGDAGDETVGGTDVAAKTVDFPADLPYVTGVGGTSVGIDRHGKRVFEYGWQTEYAPLTGTTWGTPAWSAGGGGGTSILFDQPFYQRGKVPSAISQYFGPKPMRAVPDISLAGDPNTGFRVGQTQEFPDGTYYDEYRIGGTSLSSPLLAGMLAVAAQKAHHPIGFANPLYYHLLGGSALLDVTAPKSPALQVRTNFTNSVDASGGRSFLLQTIDTQDTTIHSTRGYDAETGVGSPGPRFFSAIR
jgi:subtilase family serine protease